MVGDFYGTGIEIWAGFFMFSWAKKNFKNIVDGRRRRMKLKKHIHFLKKIKKNLG